MDDGFSLTETLVATFIFAVVGAMGVALLSSYQSSRVGLIEADEKLAQMEVARAIIRGDLFAAIERTVRDEFGTVQTSFEGGQHMLDGLRLRIVRNGDMGARLNGALSEVKRVDYLLDGQKLIRRTYVRTDLVTGARNTDQTLLEDVAGLTIRYASNGVWSEEWGTNAAASELPRMAEIAVTFRNGQQASMTFLVGAAS